MTDTAPLRLRLLRKFGHQEWLRYGVRDRVLRLFANPDTIEPCEFEADFFGFRYRGHFDSYLDWLVYFYGANEKHELLLLRDLVKHRERAVFLDVGANVGQHSLFMSRYCEHVLAFEPYAPLIQEFRQHLLDNDIRNVSIHNVALGHEDRALPFFSPRGRNRGTGSFVPSHAANNNALFGSMQVMHADRYIADLGLDRVDLVKIDVEGFEENVLEGLKNTLITYRPAVVMEFSPATRHAFRGQPDILSMLPAHYAIRKVTAYRPRCVFFANPGYVCTEFEFSTAVQDNVNLVFCPADELDKMESGR